MPSLPPYYTGVYPGGVYVSLLYHPGYTTRVYTTLLPITGYTRADARVPDGALGSVKARGPGWSYFLALRRQEVSAFLCPPRAEHSRLRARTDERLDSRRRNARPGRSGSECARKTRTFLTFLVIPGCGRMPTFLTFLVIPGFGSGSGARALALAALLRC